MVLKTDEINPDIIIENDDEISVVKRGVLGGEESVLSGSVYDVVSGGFAEKVDNFIILFDYLLAGKPQVIITSGYSGTGKSSLLNSLNGQDGILKRGLKRLLEKKRENQQIKINIFQYCKGYPKEDYQYVYQGGKKDYINRFNEIFKLTTINNDKEVDNLFNNNGDLLFSGAIKRKTINNDNNSRSYIIFYILIFEDEYDDNPLVMTVLDLCGSEIYNNDLKFYEENYQNDAEKYLKIYKDETSFINCNNNILLNNLTKLYNKKTIKNTLSFEKNIENKKDEKSPIQLSLYKLLENEFKTSKITFIHTIDGTNTATAYETVKIIKNMNHHEDDEDEDEDY